MGASLVSRLVAYSLSLLSAIAIAQSMGPDGKGLLSLATALPGLAALTLGVGLGASATVGLRERWLPLGHAARILVGYAAAVGGLCLAAGIVYWLGDPSVNAPIALAAAASVGGLLLADYAGGLLQGVGRISLGMWVRQAVGIGQAVIAIGLIGLGFAAPFPILVMMAGWAWACGGAGFLLALRADSGTRAADATARTLRRLVGFGIRAQAVWILLMLNFRLDIVLVAGLSSLEEVGVYSVAVGFSEVAWFGANAVVSILLPHLSGVDPVVAASRTKTALVVASASTLALSVACCIGLIILVEPLFGRAFGRAPLALAALVPGLVAMAGFKVFAVASVASHRTAIPVALASVGIVLNIALNIQLVPTLGSVGAAMASSGSYLLISAVGVAVLLRRIRRSRAVAARTDDARNDTARAAGLIR